MFALELRMIGYAEDDASRRHADLTARETEVLGWIAEGKTNPEIAQILTISLSVVKTHVGHILQKLKVENRTAAAISYLASAAEGEIQSRTPITAQAVESRLGAVARLAGYIWAKRIRLRFA